MTSLHLLFKEINFKMSHLGVTHHYTHINLDSTIANYITGELRL